MKKTMQFNLDVNSMKIREILTTKDFLVLEFWALSDVYPNNNNSHFPLKSMELNVERGSFYNKPVLGKFNNLSNNYEVHNYKTKYDPEYDMEYCDYEDGERPLGLIRESDTVKIVKGEDGLNWIVFTAVIWVKYNYKGVKKLLTSRRSKVSVEVTINKWHEDDRGIEIYEDWTFDGVTILGYQKNSLKEAKEGIPSAHMTILEKMKRNTFSNQIKSLKFAYDELSDIDINEDNTHLYIEQEADKEAIQLTYEDKKDLLQQALNKTFEGEELIIDDISDNTVIFTMNEIKKTIEYSIDEDASEVTFTIEEEKTIEENALEGEAFEEEKTEDQTQEEKTEEESEEKTEEETQENSEEECGKFEENIQKEETQEEKTEEESEEADCKKDYEKTEEESVEDNSEKKDNFEEDDTSDEDEDAKSEDRDEDPDDKDDDKKEEESSEEQKEECGKFVIDDKEYTAEEVVEKYFADMKQAKESYDELKTSYDELSENYNNLNKDFEACENKLKKFETQELVNEVKEVLKKADFTKEEETSFIERCEKREFNSIQEATKEIAYIAFMNKENTNQNNEVEFSAKVDFTMKSRSKTTDKVVGNCFDALQNYVNK